MSKRFREAVEVSGDSRPVAFRWRGRTYEVLGVVGYWREDAGYWIGGGVEIPQRDLWRVEAVRRGRSTADGHPTRTPGRGVYELVCEGGRWRLDRVWD